MKKYFLQAHRILAEIYCDGKYGNMAFYGAGTDDMTTKLVYGVLENDVKIEYVVSELVQKKPQKSILILLKIGIYALENLTEVPQFAIVSECVEAAKALGKSGASGFVNAVLKKVATKSYTLPKEDDADYLSVTYSKPQWFVDRLIVQYGKETALTVLSAQSQHFEHIRINSRVSSVKEVCKRLDGEGEKYTLSEVGGISVRATATVKRMFEEGMITYQSPSSMLAVQALAPKKGERILDLCSAPGGKAVYMSETCESVTACELHPHRINLIEKYKKRMLAKNIVCVQCDATKLREEWIGKFDKVLADVPCSCMGTFLKHPDVFLTRAERQIKSLAQTQKAILFNAAKYVRKGGIVVYSTCTLFEEENGKVVESLLNEGGFMLDGIECLSGVAGGKYDGSGGSVQILPQGEYDGFYIARIKKL